MRCFVLGNGPSLNETDLDLLTREVSFGVNRCELIYPNTKWRPTYWVCGDRDLKTPIEIWAEPFLLHYLMGETCYISPKHLNRLHALPFSEKTWEEWTKKRGWPPEWYKTIVQMPRFQTMNLCDIHGTRIGHDDWQPRGWHLPQICRYAGSIPMAIQLAVTMGFDEIYLLGCDLGYSPDGDIHFSKDYTKGDVFVPFTEDWCGYLEGALRYAHELAHRECAKRGIKIFNAGIGGKLDAYPRVKLEDVCAAS